MISTLLQNETDVHQMRQLIEDLAGHAMLVDFEEAIQLASVRARTRLWKENDQLIGFAYVDDYNNLWFEILPQYRLPEIETEMVAWGVDCIRRQNAQTGGEDTLDAGLRANHGWHMAVLKRNGFEEQSQRSFHYERDLALPILEAPLPAGFYVRSVQGESEVPALVALHRAAFGTENMTGEERIAIMRVPTYEPDLDLVLVAPNGELAAFCVCGMEDAENGVGYTDPIGVHPRYQKLGLGKTVVTAGLIALKERGAKKVTLGTSSENEAMQRLAESLGFRIVSESVWFSRQVT